MSAIKLQQTMKYLTGVFSFVAAYLWLQVPAGTSESVVASELLFTLLFLSGSEALLLLFTNSKIKSLPCLVVFLLFLAGLVTGSDTFTICGALFSISGTFLNLVSLLLERVRKGGPLFVFLIFLIPVLAGAVVLSFPRCHQEAVSISPSESFFTAVSAVTVTGLTVIDVGASLSVEGQWVLLLLIQVGGIGTVSLFAFFALILGNGLGIRQGRSLRESLDGVGSSEIRGLLGTICILTLSVELIGALFLYLGSGYQPNTLEHLFHSVSAFCNAGFTLTSDSLASWSFVQKLIMAILITLGGIGFPVIHEFKKRLFRPEVSRLSIQSKLILVVSLSLFLIGSVLLLITGTGEESWFWSITCRTAGFSTADVGSIPLSSTLILMILMAIGASPGSTGGGVKTTTIGVLFLAVWAELRSKIKIVAWKRTIRDTVVRTAAVLILVAFLVWLVLLLALLTTESASLKAGKLSFVDLAFEITSALGTVGLSRNVTMLLSENGRHIVELAMLLGRLGPLAIVVGIASLTPTAVKGDRPHGRVMLG